MPSTISRVTALLLVSFVPSVTSVATPRVPWKDSGISKSQVKRQYSTGCSNGPSSRGCWEGEYDIDTDMDIHWPDTGKVVRYNLELTNGTGAPDGFQRSMMLINGQFPGPTITADWGDEIEISVTSHLQTNGTGLHWHGLRQLGTNNMDGVNGITECPLAPDNTRIYRFKATQYGTTWYHSHYSVQYGDGLLGPLVINGPTTANYDIDLGAYPLMDWFHAPIFTVNAASLHATGPPTADNILINGSMTSSFGGHYSVTTLIPGKSHLLRLINTGINNYLHVSLDGHKFTVVSADFTPIEPYETTSVTLAVGQRYDVIISATEEVDNYWLRVGTGGRCDGPNRNAANARAIFRYEGAEEVDPKNSTAAVPLPVGCDDEVNVVPHQKTTVPAEVPEELKLNFTNTAFGNGLVQWLIDGIPMLVDLDYPTLQGVADGNVTFAPNRHVFEVGEKHKWQYWVIQQAVTTPPLPHPIHLHGHDFYILDHAANTQWTGDISRLKTDNPVRRDTATLPAGGYLVLAFESDNPGAWLMHCHIPFHIAAGFGVQFLERADEISQTIGPLTGMEEGCKSWVNFRKQYYPDGILINGDSGL